MQSRQQVIKPHTGRSLYAYLRSLIAKPIDFAWIQAQAERMKALWVEQQQQVVEQKQRAQQLQIQRKALRGRTFVSTIGTRYHFEEACVAVTTQRDGKPLTGYIPLLHPQGVALAQKDQMGAFSETVMPIVDVYGLLETSLGNHNAIEKLREILKNNFQKQSLLKTAV